MGIRDAFRTMAKGLVVTTADALRKAVEDDEEDARDDEGDDAPPSKAKGKPAFGKTGDAPKAKGAPQVATGDDGEEDDSDGSANAEAIDAEDGEELPISPMAKIHGDEGKAPDAEAKEVKPPALQPAAEDPKSLLWDPYSVIDALGYKDKPTSVTYATLKSMSWRMPIIQAIIKTRLAQLKIMARPQVDRFSMGMRVRLRDPKARTTPASDARAQQLTRWMLTTGTVEPKGVSMRDSFMSFLAKVARDSLTYDQFCYEIVPGRNGKPSTFYAVDATTIRLADTSKLFIDPEDQDIVRTVQVYEGLVCAEYTASQLAFGVRNPSTDIRLQGYGQSELEMLIETVTALLWGFQYNMRFFSQGAGQKVLINLQGTVPTRELNAFRRQWYQTVAGVDNAFRTPIINAPEGVEVHPLQQSNRDMEYNAWMDFLIKVAAAIYEMDSMEINFRYGDAGAKPMFESANASKLSASKDKGLKPLLVTFEDSFNRHLVYPLDEDFEFEFTGLDANTPAEEADLNTKLVKSTKTIDELRALDGDPPLPGGLGNIILDPTFLQHMMQSQQSARAEEGLGPDGQPLPPPGSEDPNDPFGGGGDDGGDDGGGDDGGGDGDPFASLRPKPAAAAKPDKPEGGKPNPFQKSLKSITVDVEV